MNKNHLIKKAAAIFLAVWMVPFAAFAVTEGKVEDAPIGGADRILTGSGRMNLNYSPDEGLYAVWSDWEPFWEDSETYAAPRIDEDGCVTDAMQLPRLTRGETARLEKLREAFDSGRLNYDGESALNRMSDVTVGVYPLNPADYDGETVYCLLPGTCLTDGELLALLDAYHALGLTFDPAKLNYRNCTRGGIAGCSRFLTEEESARRDEIALLIARGGVAKEDPDTFAVPVIGTADKVFGPGNFLLYPYRPLTDEELAAELFAGGAEAEETFDFAAMENRARITLQQNLRLPLTLYLNFLCSGTSEAVRWDGAVLSAGEATDPCVSGFFTFTRDGRPGMLRIDMDPAGEDFSVAMEYTDLETDPEKETLTEEALIAAAREWLRENCRRKDVADRLELVPERQEESITAMINGSLDGWLYHLELDPCTGKLITFCLYPLG